MSARVFIPRPLFDNATIIKDEHECGSTLDYIGEASTLGFFAVDDIFIGTAGHPTKIFAFVRLDRDERNNEVIAANYIDHATGDTLVVFND